MELLLVRHAIALPRDPLAGDDALRPLTRRGRRRMRRAARGLRMLVPGVDLICSSPLVRARETAAILGLLYQDAERLESGALAPGAGAEAVVELLREHSEHDAVALVGHEPDLSELGSWLCAGVSRSVLELRKGAACLIAFESAPGAARGRLLWSLPPRVLRCLAP
jgi:phosphohistidine phosphatase